MQIRKTDHHDFDVIMDVEKAAFGYDKAACLVADLLRDTSAEPLLSLLAFHENEAGTSYLQKLVLPTTQGRSP